MISNYSDYIKRYVHRRNRLSPPAPGEHHFVAAYLAPKLFEINGLVPDYINPDGTKSIIGDLAYYRDERHHFGIEVKLGTIRLTRREFNTWIIGADQDQWPNLFVGLGKKGLALCSWSKFRLAYLKAVQRKSPKWLPAEISEGYGPMKRVDELAESLGEGCWFPFIDGPESEEAETRFVTALRSLVAA